MKILIIRYSSMGDVLMTTPIIRMLKIQLNATIHILTKELYISLFDSNPYVDDIYIHEYTSYSELRKERYNEIIDLQSNLRSFIIRKLIGGKGVTYNKGTLSKWLLLRFKINRFNGRHVIDRYLETIKHLGIVNDGYGLNFSLKSRFRPENQLDKKRLIAIALGGTYLTKRIPITLLNEVVSLGKKYDYILIGGNDVVDNNILLAENLFNYVGKTSIEESARILMNADVVVTGDTGMMHLAAALQKPIIVIWGSTSSDFGFYPYFGDLSNQIYLSFNVEGLNCNPCSKYGRANCPKGHMKCLTSLRPEELLNKIDKIIELLP